MAIKYFFSFFLFVCVRLSAQELQHITLQEAVSFSKENYPLIKQKDLIHQTAQLNTENLSKGFLPQISLSGQASYQSDVTKISVPIPNFSIEPLNRDQYKIVADINQLIYDGGITLQQKSIQQLNEQVEQQKIEVELYKLRERIQQIYLSILFLDEQLKQVQLIKDDLNNGIKKVSAQIENGVAFQSNLNLLKAELLKAEQRNIELKSTRKGFLDVLSLFTNKTFSNNIVLETPVLNFVPNIEIKRPELALFLQQDSLMNSQTKLISGKNLPKASLFAQGGYARPGLNFLKNEFAFYYIAGLRLNWNFGNFYTQKREKQLVDVNKKMIEVQKENFLLNTNATLKQQFEEIEKLRKLIITDNEIIELRLKVKDAANAQLQNGVITANDYLREVNAEDQARQTRITHQIQLLQAQLNYKTTLGEGL